MKSSKFKSWIYSFFKKRDDFWHFFPRGEELSIKSALEIILYILLIIGGWSLFQTFQKVKTHKFEMRIEQFGKIDTISNSIDSIGINIANIKFNIPATDERTKAKKSVDVTTGFFREHSFFRTIDDINKDKDSLENFNDYYKTLKYVNTKYDYINFNDSSCYFELFIQNNIKPNINNIVPIRSDSTEESKLLKESNLLIEAIFRLTLYEQMKQLSTVPDEIFGNNSIYKIFKSKHQSAKLAEDTVNLRNTFINAIIDSIGEDSLNRIPIEIKEPLHYYKLDIEAPDYGPFSSFFNGSRRYVKVDNNYISYVEHHQKGHSLSVSNWVSGKVIEAPGFSNPNVLNISGALPLIPNPFSLFDISKAKYHIDIKTSTIDSINLKFDFVGCCTFSKMAPEPDVIDMHSITFTDQWKILQIKDKGLDFYVKYEEFEKTQHIRLFILEAVISGLIILLISFLIIGCYKIINFKRLKTLEKINNRNDKKVLNIMTKRKRRMNHRRK